jgi:Peptidase M15
MIKFSDLNPHQYETTPEQISNMEKLFKSLTQLIAAGAPIVTVTSGLRSDADQARINPSAPKSKHLIGAAADIYDPHGELAEWVVANVGLLEEAELWCEDLAHTLTWVHFQCISPKSGRRFFIP